MNKFKPGDKVVRIDAYQNEGCFGEVEVVLANDTFMSGIPAIELESGGKFDPRVYVLESVYYSPLCQALR